MNRFHRARHCHLSRGTRPFVGRVPVGASLIEVLVVIGIIGLLLAILLPAVAASREASRKTNCQSHLKQLAQASHSFHDVHRTLPMQNFVGVPRRFRGDIHAVSAWGQLLPYLDQGALHTKIDFDETGGGGFQEPPSSQLNPAMLTTHLPLLTCPSDNYRQGGTNYRASLGTRSGPSYARGSGAYFSLGKEYRRATFAMITDGLSQTTLCSERLLGDFDPSIFDPKRDVYYVGSVILPDDPDSVRQRCSSQVIQSNSPHLSLAGATWFLNGNAWVWYNHVDTPNSRIADCSSAGIVISPGKVSARSMHPGGVNVAMADGAVRFVSDSIDLNVWRAYGTRSGKEILSE